MIDIFKKHKFFLYKNIYNEESGKIKTELVGTFFGYFNNQQNREIFSTGISGEGLYLTTDIILKGKNSIQEDIFITENEMTNGIIVYNGVKYNIIQYTINKGITEELNHTRYLLSKFTK